MGFAGRQVDLEMHFRGVRQFFAYVMGFEVLDLVREKGQVLRDLFVKGGLPVRLEFTYAHVVFAPDSSCHGRSR